MSASEKGDGAAQELTAATKRAAAESLTHSEDLLEAAKQLLDSHHHLAYHLGVLSLEEIGRSSLIVMEEVAAENPGPTAYRRRAEDHEWKLFWALWGPTFGHDRLSGEQIESFRAMAREINERRQSGLYYDVDGLSPRKAVTAQESEQLVALAEARLELARTRSWRRLDDQTADELSWLLNVGSDPQYRGLVFGSASMEKLADLHKVGDWVGWLREQVAEGEEQAAAATRRELARPEPPKDEAGEPKWTLRFRLESDSHSIRSKPLRWWNGVSDWIKLMPVSGKNRELDVELTLPKAVPLNGLWHVGLGTANRFVVALNIASKGHFWWEMPTHVSRFYDRLTDLESSDELRIDRSPKLKIDWGNDVLSEEILRLTALCFGAIPGPEAKREQPPFDHYLHGLALLAKTDVFLQFEANSFEQFYLALREASRLYKHSDDQAPFAECLQALLVEMAGEAPEWRRLLDGAELIEAGRQRELQVDLSDVAMMKLVGDAFFAREFRRQFEEAGS